MSLSHNDHYTREEAQGILGVSAAEIRRLVKQGELRYEFAAGGHKIPADAVRGLLAKNTGTAKAADRGEAAPAANGGKAEDASRGKTRAGKAGHNPFVDHLNGYVTVSPEHASAFDEFSSKVAPPPGGRLEIETRVEEFLKERFSGRRPSSVILTGNAGDGKTYLCRRIFEAFSGEETPIEWGDDSQVTVRRDGLELRLVKDLSEIDQQEGERVLRDLQTASGPQDQGPVFLIAANEGRLRALLRQDDLEELRRKADAQLRGESPAADDRLLVINLNKATTSSYVARVITWIAKAEQWHGCEGCPAFDGCPIRFNASRLAERRVTERLTTLYRVLEHLDVHVTVRDMLIHLAYVVTGGLSCDEVIREHRKPDHDLHTRSYYQNCWGSRASVADLRKVAVVNHLLALDVGDQSLYEVDDFIINGESADREDVRSEHARLFAPAVDLKGKYLEQRRYAYLRGDAVSGSSGAEEFLRMLPHCRRKLFFEWQDEEKATRLTPFQFLPDYLKLLGGHGALDRAKSELVAGLNRALTGLFVTRRDVLFVTSQYAHAVENPVPMVRVRIPELNVALLSESEDLEWSEGGRRNLMLKVADPWAGKPPVSERIDLLRFEYLMRLARGGTYNVLAEECSLFVRELKDNLLTSFAASSDHQQDRRLTFFGIEDDEYVLKELRFDDEGKLWT